MIIDNVTLSWSKPTPRFFIITLFQLFHPFFTIPACFLLQINFFFQFKKVFCFKNCTDLSMFEWIVQVISTFLQILGLRSRIKKKILISRSIFCHSRSEQFWKQDTNSSLNSVGTVTIKFSFVWIFFSRLCKVILRSQP